MFDVSFSELVIIAVVALIVIGPEKLPKVARTLGAITGRLQKYVAQIKEEVNRDVRFQELQQLQQEIQTTAANAQAKIKSDFLEVSQTLNQEVESLNHAITSPWSNKEDNTLATSRTTEKPVKKTSAKKAEPNSATPKVKKPAVKK